QAHQVLAYEVDQRLIPVLENELADFDNLTIKHQDILKADVATDITENFDADKPLAVVSNLPYYITTPIIFHLLEETDKIDTFALMMQSEVADRLTAEPGTKAYGSLTVIMNYYCEAKIAQRVPVTVFKPRPKVNSAILVLNRRKQPIVTVDSPDQLINVVRIAFAHRRKTLWNNLRSGLVERSSENEALLKQVLAETGIDGQVRAEQLAIESFADLANATGRLDIPFEQK
ncbi:MAG: 16S rRNA (adenine(1518)-N(6)/adenine(1519)-N(6))-dimethyltransferase RsmA, partial [Aerococcus sp.]|nr:16S rRNA (adenine(1518)-N(6)/adenine(1519)-N(6))-dimethyltransferase RsmA [Aerococcus sp.]